LALEGRPSCLKAHDFKTTEALEIPFVVRNEPLYSGLMEGRRQQRVEQPKGSLRAGEELATL
jgi:hypothetical protein